VSAAPQKPAFGVRDLDEFTSRLAQLRAELQPVSASQRYVAHTDGACFGNPEGPGGWAAVVETADPEHTVPDEPWLLWGHLSSTSNNRAEALGVLAAMEWVPSGAHLSVISDSELTVRILQGRYKARANPDIWDRIRRTIADKRLEIVPDWVRGHAGHAGNELADRLTRLGASNARTDASTLELLGAHQAASVPEPRRVAKTRSMPAELEGLTPQGDWERQFLQSVAQQLNNKRALSPKQQAIIDRIRARGA
jgi:ribonuclease HI/DNA polymerase-3 subunit epsilon